MATVTTGFERQNADKFQAHLTELQQDHAQRTRGLDNELKAACKYAAGSIVRRNRGRTSVYGSTVRYQPLSEVLKR